MDRRSFNDQSIAILGSTIDPQFLENASSYGWSPYDLDGTISRAGTGGNDHFDGFSEDLVLDHLEMLAPRWCAEPYLLNDFDERPAFGDSPSPSETKDDSPGASRLSCRVCDSFFDNRAELEDHAKSSGHASFFCQHPGCGKSYNRRDVYSRHKKTHQTMTAFQCDLCPIKPFKRKDHLQQHKKTVHPSTIRKSPSIGAGLHRAGKATSLYRSSECVIRQRRPSDDSISDTDSQYENSAVRNIVDQIGSYLGEDTEPALRLFLQQVELQRKCSSNSATR